MYLTYDLGTTALKTALVSGEGKLLSACTCEYLRALMPQPGWMETPFETYWQAVVESTRRIFSQSQADPRALCAICFSSQAQTFIPLDHCGQPLYNAIIWLDTRAKDITVRWEREWLSRERYRRISGYAWIPPELTVFKIAWLLEHQPDLKKTWKFLCLPDAIIYRLSGETATDSVTARMGGLFNYSLGNWEPDLLEAAGITPEQLPQVWVPGSVVGRVNAAAAWELGIPQGVAVCVGANDQLVGAVGAGNVQSGIVSETTGTALAVVTTLHEALDDDRVTLGTHAVPGLYYAMAFANNSANLLGWLRQVCDKEQEDFPAFLAGTASVPPGCDGLTVLPHFSGDGSTPARGAFIGLTLAHTRAHLARAIMETCACLLRGCLEPVLENHLPVARVRSLGGASKSDLWLQIKADLLGLEVERPACPDTNSLGAAMLAAWQTGQFTSLADAAAAWYRPATVFTPNPALHGIYEEVYNRYHYYNQLLYGSLAKK